MSRIALMIVASGLVALASCTTSAEPSGPDLDSMWEEWKQTYGKQYTDSAEEMERRMVWEENLRRIIIHNLENLLGEHTFDMRINMYGDMRISEVRAAMNGYMASDAAKSLRGSPFLALRSTTALPDTVDWRQQGYVTPVKNQRTCQSGDWAFSAIGALEGQTFRFTGVLPVLSAQNLLDCTKSYGNEGCAGGLVDAAFEYVKDNRGIDSEMGYPYFARELGYCYYNAQYNSASAIGFFDLPSGDEDALKTAVATIGPIAVTIDASAWSFHAYRSGVYYEPSCSSDQVSHGALVVGYGTENGQDYWLVKNSWGEMWGDQGYIKMSRNMDNQCGIATRASYPLV